MRKILFFTLFLVSSIFARSITIPVVNPESGISQLNMDINGKNINFLNYPAKYVVLEYFGAHCPVCQAELKHMKNINKDPSIQVVGVEVQGTSEDDLKKFIKENDVKYPIISYNNSLEFYNYAPEWNGKIPMIIIFAQNGVPIKKFLGFKKEEELINAMKGK